MEHIIELVLQMHPRKKFAFDCNRVFCTHIQRHFPEGVADKHTSTHGIAQELQRMGKEISSVDLSGLALRFYFISYMSNQRK